MQHLAPLFKKQNCMHFAEEHFFGCASALHDCSGKYDASQ